MKVVNFHKRTINQSKDEVSQILETLSTKEDKIWPYEKWPAIRFKNGLRVGSDGGHGPIRYTIIDMSYEQGVLFRFTDPKGFNGTHEFGIHEISNSKVEVSHSINMKTSGFATYYWLFVIRWLHDALIEDAFDKLENNFSIKKKVTTYNIWVILLRLLKSKKGKRV